MPPVRGERRSEGSGARAALRGVRRREGVRGAPAGRSLQEVRCRSGTAARLARAALLEAGEQLARELFGLDARQLGDELVRFRPAPVSRGGAEVADVADTNDAAAP